MTTDGTKECCQARNAFCNTIETTALSRACIEAVEDDLIETGSGLKLLRLVSKQFNAAMLRSVTGYTLKVDGITEALPEFSLLSQLQLSNLTVELVADPTTSQVGPGHARHVKRFVTAARLALHTVTEMYLSVIECEDGLEIRDLDVELALSSLPHACTLLQHLKVTGNVGPSLLAVFGAACKHLTSLHTVDIGPSTAERLCELLPQVTSTHMMLATEEDYNTGTPEDYLVAVSNCRTLHHLDLGMLPLSSNLWRAMPPCVQLLHAGAISDPDTSARGGAFSAWPQLPNLEFASLYSDGMPLCLLANLLRAAPKLSQISMGNVWVPSRVDQIPDLILLHKRMSEGLQIQEASQSRHDADLMLQFRDLPVLQHAESPATSFISSLPVFEHFAHVGVETVERPCYASLAKVFPRLSLLRISSMVAASSFPSLAKEFPALQILCLDSQQNTLTALQVGLLCLQMPSLQVLQVRSPGIDRKALKRGLRTWDHLVSITVLQELDEDED